MRDSVIGSSKMRDSGIGSSKTRQEIYLIVSVKEMRWF